MGAFVSACRYSLLNALACVFLAAMLSGSRWIWASYLTILIATCVFDEGIGDGREEQATTTRWIYLANLYATIPILIALTIVYLHHLTPGDPIGFKQALSWLGFNFTSLISIPKWDRIIAATFGTAYFYALAGMTVAHELSHRATRPAQIGARILLAFTLNTPFVIAHVHGHHRKVATYRDPGSARRNEYVLAFAVRCTIGQAIEGFQLEAERLRRKGLAAVSWHNSVLRDQLYPLTIYVVAAIIAGWRGVVGFTIAAIVGTLLQKLVDYSQHYGLVRVDGAPFEPRHAWDCHRFLSNAIQMNLPLHAHHHKAARTPFWELKPTAGAPRLPCGYQTASYVALIPPLWHRMIDPILAEWDRNSANAEERALIRERGWEIAPKTGANAVGARTGG